jgi:uncharacterized protein (DUF1800 family)
MGLDTRKGFNLAASEVGFKNDELAVQPIDVGHSSSDIEFMKPLLAGASALLAGCGGGGTSGSSGTPTSPTVPTDAEAARFLLHASLAASDADIQYVISNGMEAWINQQATMTSSISRVNWLNNAGFSAVANMNSTAGLDNVLWHHLIAEKNTFVQRISLFWSEFFVVSVLGLPVAWRQFMAASYMDTLETYSLGNFRDLLKAVTLSPGMGEYLSLAGSQKSNAATNRHPDENYAREIMQLFTIGLFQLNNDGTVVLNGSKQPIDTYTQNDILGLAAAFTGWGFSGSNSTYAYAVTPMGMIEGNHQSSTSNSFLGVTIPSGTSGAQSLEIILDTLFNHANLPPFLAKRMIQNLVSSNPSAAYVQRVANVFINNGKGVRGDTLAVAKAVLLDTEATQAFQTLNGKVREPMLRFVQWARTFGAVTATGVWGIGDTSDPSTRLYQSPLRAPSVFGFFDPIYSPPNSALSAQYLLAPEMQLIDENSVAGYLNYLQSFVTNGASDLIAPYTTELSLAANANQLIARLNLLLAANQLSTTTINSITGAINAMSVTTPANLLSRVQAAVYLVMASPDYLVIR